MTEVLFFIISIANISLVIYSLARFKKNPLSFEAILFFLHFVFYFIPAVDYFFDLNMFSNEYLFLNGSEYNDQNVIRFAGIGFIIMVSFMIGYRIRYKVGKKVFGEINEKIMYIPNLVGFTLVKVLLFAVLFLVLLTAFMNYNYNLTSFFSMARKEAYSNTYETILVSMLPLLLLSMEFVYQMKYLERITLRIVGYIAVVVLATITLGQRRELINNLIFIFFLFLEAYVQKMYYIDLSIIRKKLLKPLVFLAIVIVILIPLTWYLRVYSTQLQYGNIVNPFKVRGWLELIFGSSSSGLQTSVILEDYDNYYGLPFLASIRLIVTYWIPRTLYADKVMLITQYVKQTLHTSGNLSVFFINDVWFTFYYLSPVFSLIIGSIVRIMIEPINNKNVDLVDKIPAYLAFSKIITLYKNGFATFFLHIIIFNIFWAFIKKVALKKQIRSEMSELKNKLWDVRKNDSSYR